MPDVPISPHCRQIGWRGRRTWGIAVSDMQPSCLLFAVVEAGPGAAERLGAALAAVQISPPC